jgi:hypothetical protein
MSWFLIWENCTGWSKSLCAPDDCTVIVRFTEIFDHLVLYLTGVEQEVNILKLEVHFNTTVLKDSVSTSQKTQSLSQISLLILSKGIIADYSGSHREHVVLLYGKEKADLIPKAGGYL